MEPRNSAAIVAALAQAEEKLQFVITESAKEALYSVSRAASIAAESIRGIRDQLGPQAAPAPRTPAGQPDSGRPKTGHREDRRTAYPRFHFKSDTLYRVGWSKKERKEYTHKVPRTTYQLIVCAMEAVAKATPGPLMADRLIEELQKLGGDPVSTYQVYVVIGFLRDRGAIEQDGRSGYSIPTDFESRAQAAWGH